MTSDLPYDPDARRDTPLARKLKAYIGKVGPISVGSFMHACLHDPDHGYYRTRSPIGQSGDFITAPEISQVFGELIGLWCAGVWEQMKSPADITLVEVGPGRGTLLRDALRALRVAPAFKAAVKVLCVESNPALEAVQRQTLADTGHSITWSSDFTQLRLHLHSNPTPHIMIFNEILDTLHVEQAQRVIGRWYERRVGVDASDRLVFVVGDEARYLPDHVPSEAPDGAIFEYTRMHWTMLWSKVKNTPSPPIAALYVDYGQTQTALGESLQAVRGHAFEHPLCSPGEADLSAQVDFEQFTAWVRKKQLRVDGPVTQAEFLGSLGIMQRASRLIAANPDKANEIETGVARLMVPNGMGTRFKVIGVRSPHLPPLPGFPIPSPPAQKTPAQKTSAQEPRP